MDGGSGNVRRVSFSFGRNQTAGQQGDGQSLRLRWKRQYLTALQGPNSVGHRCRIASLNLLHHQHRNK